MEALKQFEIMQVLLKLEYLKIIVVCVFSSLSRGNSIVPIKIAEIPSKSLKNAF